MGLFPGFLQFPGSLGIRLRSQGGSLLPSFGQQSIRLLLGFKDFVDYLLHILLLKYEFYSIKSR
jgi:hypothetical protein